jgi:hypothetical protein
MRAYLTALAAYLAVLALALPLAAGQPAAEDHEAGVPLAPSEAAGAWTLETQGHSVCVLTLGASKRANGAYPVRLAGDCGDALPAGIAGWAPAPTGMTLLGADGRPAVQFDRWSNSLFVSKRSRGADIQLTRGAPAREP